VQKKFPGQFILRSFFCPEFFSAQKKFSKKIFARENFFAGNFWDSKLLKPEKCPAAGSEREIG